MYKQHCCISVMASYDNIVIIILLNQKNKHLSRAYNLSNEQCVADEMYLFCDFTEKVKRSIVILGDVDIFRANSAFYFLKWSLLQLQNVWEYYNVQHTIK